MRFHILDIPIDALVREAAVRRLVGLLADGRQHIVTTPNPEMLVLARRDGAFADVLRRSDLAIPDGVGLRFAARLYGGRIPERISGADFVHDVASQAAERGMKVFLLGGREGVAARSAEALKRAHPGLVVVGARSGGVLQLKLRIADSELDQIRRAAPDVLLVAFGHGRQEKWIAAHLSSLPSVKVAMGVGGTFDFLAEKARRAPRWMRRSGLEWAWRLVTEPRRWRRILTAVVVFPMMVMIDRMRTLFMTRSPNGARHRAAEPGTNMVRVRFAPSPTGLLHIGSLRTALYNELFVLHHKGTFILRIEDTDRARYVEGAVENILRSLEWAGIHPREGVALENGVIAERGSRGPYFQSKRLDIYREHATRLLDAGAAYRCFCSEETLDAMRKAQSAEGKPMMYDRRCAAVTAEEAKRRADSGEIHVVRLRIPSEGDTSFNDSIRGRVTFENRLVDDQVLIKSDSFPTYHLANVVDDHLMEITHVIRGEEWLPSTPKHIILYRAFGWEPPTFAHLPLLLNADRSKLSKRQGDVAVEDYRRLGYLPEAIVNFVALLGWNPSADREIFSKEELAGSFDLGKINKGGAVFNLEKLDWLNGEYIKLLPDDRYLALALPFLAGAGTIVETEKGRISKGGWPLTDEMILAAISLERTRIKTLKELSEGVAFLFDDLTYEAALLPGKKGTSEIARERLSGLRDFLAGLDQEYDDIKALEAACLALVKERGWTNAETLWPLRVALTGREKSPSPFEVAWALGKERVISRIDAAIRLLA